MKYIASIILLSAALAMSANFISPQSYEAISPASNDSTANTSRLNFLQQEKIRLQKQIKAEDAKRNRQIAGVSAEKMEELNNTQDSVCLALRSDLTSVILEIKELSRNISNPQLIQQISTLLNRKDSTDNDTGNQIQPASQDQPQNPTE